MPSTPVRTLVAFALLAAAGSQAGSAASSSNRVVFADERGEQAGSPDITRVVVSNDDSGRMTFRIDTPSHPTFRQDMRVRVYLSVRGADYFLLVDPFKPTGIRALLYRCTAHHGGATCTPQAATSLGFRYVGGARFSFDASEVGIDPSVSRTTRIAFYALTYAGIEYEPGAGYDLMNARIDRAPSGQASWVYRARFGQRVR